MNIKSLLGIGLVLGMGTMFGCGYSSGPAPVVANVAVGGVVAQGKVSGATVFADKIGSGTNYVLDAGELSTTTAADGSFSLSIPVNYGPYRLVTKGGTDTSTGLTAIQLIATQGDKNITPLTTMVHLNPASKAGIETLLGGGNSYDSNISTATISQTSLIVIKSIEASIKSLSDAITTKSTALTDTQKAGLQAQVAQSIATIDFSTFTSPTTISTQIAAKIKSTCDTSLTSLFAAGTDTAAFSNAIVRSAVSTAATAVTGNNITTADITNNTAASSTVLSNAVTKIEGTVFAVGSAASTSIKNAIQGSISSSKTSVPPVTTPVSFTSTITTFIVPVVASTTPSGTITAAASVTATFNVDVVNDTTSNSSSVTNRANWVVTDSTGTVTGGTVTYDSTSKKATLAGLAIRNGSTVKVTLSNVKANGTDVTTGTALTTYSTMFPATWSFTLSVPVTTGATGGTGASSINF